MQRAVSSGSEPPLVSIIIPHQAGTEILLHCLESLFRDPYPRREVLLVDNGSSDGSVALALRRFPEIEVLRLEENQGYAGGCNRGIERARGDYVVLLNDDTELEPGWLAEMVHVAERDPEVGACQPRIRSLRRRSHFEYSGAAGGLMDVYGFPFSRGRLMDHVEEDRGQYDDPIEIFWASGVCVLIRRRALLAAGPFDETFFSYMEEIDLCWRLHLQGFRVVYVPGAVVYHIGGYSLDQRVRKRMYLNHRNSLLMLMKNYSWRSLLWILPVRLALELGIALGGLVRNPRRSLAVLQSFAWLAAHGPAVWRLRAGVQAARQVPDDRILESLYLGMAPVWYFVFGIRQVRDLPDIDRVLHRPWPRDRKPGPEGAADAAAGESVRPERRDFLAAYLDQAPTARALVRAAQCRALSAHALTRPILELGCGDGVFARMLLNGVPVDFGVEADAAAAARARATGCYTEVRHAAGGRLPLEDGRVATAFCTGWLAGTADPDASLAELRRVLRPGGRAFLTLPGPAAGRDAPAPWRERLLAAGFELEAAEPYLAPRAARLRDAFLPLAALSEPWARRRGVRLLFPRAHRLVVRSYRQRLRPAFDEAPAPELGVLLRARRV